MKAFRIIFFCVVLPVSMAAISLTIWQGSGALTHLIAENQLLFSIIFLLILGHMAMASMSISFHRHHTHGGITLNGFVDITMQTILWLVTSMNMADWVAIHKVHHKHSDKPGDPHGPIARGFWHSLLLGWVDYNKGRRLPEVMAVREKIEQGPLERFYHQNPIAGPFLLGSIFIVLFGIELALIYTVCCILLSPLFAVGGVNTLAHWWGYKNHNSHDNSRNLGFILPVNMFVCGEMDHNNHHAHQKSASFRHRWFEFDLGFVYIHILKFLGLARIKFAFSPATMKAELSRKWLQTLEKNAELKERLHVLASELKMNSSALKENISDKIAGKRIKLSRQLNDFKREVFIVMRANYKFERAAR